MSHLQTPINFEPVRYALVNVGSVTTEASDLGFPVVEWPSSFYIYGVEECFNYWKTLRDENGTMYAFVYKGNSTGREITVLND